MERPTGAGRSHADCRRCARSRRLHDQGQRYRGVTRGAVRQCVDALRPHATGAGGYINTMADIEEDRVRASYGLAKYERLARIKATYDPDNVFHRNVNVKPALQPI
jgi:Berberine and berberine like